MRRRALFIVSLLIISLFATFVSPVLAQGELKLEITSPGVGERVRGRVPIIGSATVPNFQFYKVEFGIGPNPNQWAVIGSLHDQPVINNQLEVWDTTVLPDDLYTLRLTGVKQDGNWEEFYVRNLVVANQEPTLTPTPTATPTPDGTQPTPTTESPSGPGPGTDEPESAVTPESTPNVQIIAPTAPLMAPTATPTLSRPSVVRDLPIDTDNLGQSFCFGGLAMGAVFMLLGIVFGIRQLL